MSFVEKHKKLFIGLGLLCFAALGAGCFPAYSFTKDHSAYMAASNLAVNLFWAFYLGCFGADAFPKFSGINALAFNLALILASMLARYLIEFGEISNTYNFTLPNILLHIFLHLSVSTLSWLWLKKRKERK